MRSTEQFYDVFFGGRWLGMTRGHTIRDARDRIGYAPRSRVTLVPYYGLRHPGNCQFSGGNHPNPAPEPAPIKPIGRLI